MLSSKKGAAILQVLLAAAILAGISVLLLRSSLSRTSSSRQARREIAAQLEIESCMAEVNRLWAIKTPESFARDMGECIFYCNDSRKRVAEQCDPNHNNDSTGVRTFTCQRITDDNNTTLRHQIIATIDYKDSSDHNKGCTITYEIQKAADL